MFLHQLSDEILLQVCLNLTSDELCQLSLSCRALSRVAFDILSRSIKLDYAYRDDQSVWKLNGFISQLKRRSIGAISGITIAHLAWPVCSVQLRRRMLQILSMLSNIQTLHLKEHYGLFYGLYIQNDTPLDLEENFYDVLMRTSSAASIRSLTIEDSRISVDDILKLFTMKQLEHLSIDGLNNPMGIVRNEEIHSSQLESLAISASRNVTGRHIDLLFGQAPRLRKLTWHFDFRWILDEEQFWKTMSPAAISKALSPLRYTLVELDISLTETRFRNDKTLFDLSNFPALKVLKIHDRVLFPSDGGLGIVDPNLDLDFSRRLPPNLRVLEILFDFGQCRNQTSGLVAKNYAWIFTLAKSKTTQLKSLRSVSITYRGYIEDSDLECDEREWELPIEARKACDKAGIVLSSFKRSSKGEKGSSAH